MFPLTVKTSTDGAVDARQAVAEALRSVILLPGQEPVMCSGCGHWWVTESYEYTKYSGGNGRFARIPSCPHCDLGEEPAPASAGEHVPHVRHLTGRSPAH